MTADDHSAEPLSDLELLRVETGLLWDLDDRGRVRGSVELAVGVAIDGIISAIGEGFSDDVAMRVRELAARGGPARPGDVPSFVGTCRKLLAAGKSGELLVSGGPSYYVAPPIHVVSQVSVLRSDSPQAADHLVDRRPDNWEPEEWIELVGGGSGAPWAMVLDQDHVVSICHTPGRTATAAEAGTWTAPEFRKRGYAAATTAAWADLLATECPHLFYSTSADNYSSQHVAERLGLRPIGWTWKLTRTTASASSNRSATGNPA